MALTPKFSLLAVNTKADALGALANGGKLSLYNGTQPASADTPVTTQTLLVTITLANPAFASAVSGVATANPPAAPGIAIASGIAAWFRLYEADGVTALFDGSVDTANANLLVTTTSIVVGATVPLTALTITELRG